LSCNRGIRTRAGHEVVIAENGAQGLVRTDRRLELIVVDLMMPNMNGYEFVKQLRAADGQAAVPVIAASGLATGEWALRAGADRFLRKPFRRHELIAVVDELLGGGTPAA
jgi:CheY-like chemotaxis protein